MFVSIYVHVCVCHRKFHRNAHVINTPSPLIFTINWPSSGLTCVIPLLWTFYLVPSRLFIHNRLGCDHVCACIYIVVLRVLTWSSSTRRRENILLLSDWDRDTEREELCWIEPERIDSSGIVPPRFVGSPSSTLLDYAPHLLHTNIIT